MSIVQGNDNSMKVAVRLRSHEETILSNYIKTDNNNIIFTHNKGNLEENFTYDYVFDELISQCHIYNEAISKLVIKCLDGFNVSTFAYGQTGSGKTYTIGSSKVNATALDETEGIISRTLRNLFYSNDENLIIRISLIEIYKDNVYDLLSVSKTKCVIQNYQVKDLTKLVIKDMTSMALIQNGILLRKVGKTSMNEESSRSHLVLTIYLENIKNLQRSKFNIIDLAGPEKAGADYKNSSSSKTALEEGSFINNSLMDLRLLIQRLAAKVNASYTNCLTKILKDSLGGNSYSLLIACINCKNVCFSQTLETLKFANMVKSIKNNPIKLITPVLNETFESSLMDELQNLRKFKKEYDQISKNKEKEFRDKRTSPIKFKNIDSSILVSNIGNEDSSILVSNIGNDDSSILVSNIGNEDSSILFSNIGNEDSSILVSNIGNEDSSILGKRKYDDLLNGPTKKIVINKLEEFMNKKRCLNVGLKISFENDYESFKFLFFKKCYFYLNNSPQFPTKHECRRLKKGATVVFRCIKFYSKIDKCRSQIKFNYIIADDSLEIVSNPCCDHFQNLSYQEKSQDRTDDEISISSNKKKAASVFL